MKVIEIKNLKKTYKDNIIFSDLSIFFETGKLYAIIGESGCGKTTLFKIISLIEKFDKGELIINKKNIKNLTNDSLLEIRNKDIGFIFQNYFLNEHLTVLENVCLPMLINKELSTLEKENKARVLLNKFGLLSKINDFPKKLSGGMQQRVAIARALINNPNIILADEPTGNLDQENEKIVFEELKKLSRNGKCVIVVTHSEFIKKYADVIYNLEELK